MPRPGSSRRPQPAAVALSESDVTRQVRDYLAYRGWRAVRMQSGQFGNMAGGRIQVGEPGMPDMLFVHYLGDGKTKPVGISLVLWIEVKKPGARMICHCEPHNSKVCRMHRQMKWRAREEDRGGLVQRVDDIRVFIPWYEETFAWLHRSSGQLDLFLAEVGA